MSVEEYDMIVKIVIIGDSFVGKSNILTKYLKNEFNQDSKSTVGVEFGSKTFTIQDNLVKVQIWDTAGQDRFKAITKAYYKGARGALIVYDITKTISFGNTDKWITDLKVNSNPDISMMLIGNKNDLKDLRQVTQEEAEQKARDYNIAFLETSAKTGTNIEMAFEKLIYEVVEKNIIEIQKEQQTIEIGKSNNIPIEKKKQCC